MTSMRRLALAGAGAILFACGSPSAPEASWVQVAEQTSCEALAPRYCVGGFGFTVESDGHFTVGPAENGARVTGSLSSDERLQLSADVAQVSAGLPGNAECDAAATVPGSRDQVDLLEARQVSVRVYDLGGTIGNVCYRGGRAQAARLHADMSALTAKYYPRPFPPL
jgi:hypothetical protein